MSAKPLSTSFPPLVHKRSKVLILGSMPGVESLRQQQYYAHPRNAFWPIMASLCRFSHDQSYSERCEQVLAQGIAVWDVLKTCHRPGSLDQHIDDSTIETNDFNQLLTQHTDIHTLVFNGAKAEQVFRKHVLPELKPEFRQYELIRLPSTSPAHAAMTLAQKTLLWQHAIEPLLATAGDEQTY